jgi:hypothetical protein
MARWRVDYIGKRGQRLGTVNDERDAVEQAAKQFHITPARRKKIMVKRSAPRAQRRAIPKEKGASSPSSEGRGQVAVINGGADARGLSMTSRLTPG